MLEITALLTWLLHREVDTYIILVLLAFNSILAYFQEGRASRALEYLKQRLQINARVRRDSEWKLLPARELVPGDLVRLRSGDFAPADVKLLDGSLELDQSALTGESLTVEKNIGEVVPSGVVVVRGESDGVIAATGIRTSFGKTVQLVQIAKPKLHMEQVISKIVAWLLVMVAALLAVSLAADLLQGGDIVQLLPLAVILLVSAIPVALPTMFAISMALGSLSLARSGVLLTKLSAGEDAATMNVLCVDKTGTITLNKLSVSEIKPSGSNEEADVVRYACLASREADQDPIDLAILSAAQRMQIPLEGYRQVEFVPFTPATRMTRARIEKDGRSFHVWKGAVSSITQVCSLQEDVSRRVSEQVEELSRGGYRTLAVAVESETGPSLVGLVGLSDPARSDSRRLVLELRRLGIAIKMLTGDALPIAREAAAKIGLEGDVVKVSHLRENPAEFRSQQLIEQASGFAEIYPEDKYRIVSLLQQTGHVVGMTGDGVNDAPALRQAEVGIAVSNGTDVTKSAAAAVLTTEGLEGIVELVKTGRRIYQRIITWILNKIVKTFQIVVFVVLAFLFTGSFVVSVFSMILFLFVTDFVTLALSTDNARYSEKPDTWRLGGLARVGVLLGIVIVAESFLLLMAGFYLFDMKGSLGGLQTFIFDYLVFLSVLDVLSFRERGHLWESKPSRPLLIFVLGDILVVSLLSMVGLPLLAPIGLEETLFALAFSIISSFGLNDIIKVSLVRRFEVGTTLAP